ncbi:MAG: Allophanate hydrolase subunit 1, partial [Chloroflexi bacterium]|nr:Allophanate hydrolase subunit 1 [Chloroflexota bacterium]
MSLDPTLSVLPVGEAACLLELGETSPATTARARTLARAVLAAGWTGVYDAVPAYRTVLIRFDPEATDLSEIEPQIQQLNSMAVADIESEGSIIELPVLYGGELGPDLEDVALHTGLPPDEVVRRHASALYTVEFLGFSPGFPYLSGLPPELSIPRLAAPRSRVPAGAVAIAGHQTGFYPLASPGGWRLIGRIQSFTFDPARPETLPYRPGDRIRFVPIHDSTPASAGSSDAQLPSRDIDDALQQSPLRPPESGIPSIDTPSASPSPRGLDFGPARLG